MFASPQDDVEVPATFRFRFVGASGLVSMEGQAMSGTVRLDLSQVGCLTHGLRRAWRNLSHAGSSK